MALKSILVHVDETPHCPERVGVALRLAAAHGAQLAGLYVMPSVLPPVLTPGELTPELLEILENRRRQGAQRAEANFATARKAMPQANWRVVDDGLADEGAVLARQARGTDLLVIGQSTVGEEDSDRPGSLTERVALAAGRPVLAVPFAGRFPTVGERALIAWNGSREAARAVADALPLLHRAKAVTVLTIDDRGEAAEGQDDVLAWLGAHGIAAKPEHAVAQDISVGDLLLARLSDLDADLLVMGAYGHSRWRELVLGGATRSILSHMTVPVLLSH